MSRRAAIDVFRYLDYRVFLADHYRAGMAKGLSYRSFSKLASMMLVAAIALTGCTNSQLGTETGNPPWVSETHIRVAAIGENKVRVSGDAGAVRPGGGEVAVRNLTLDSAAVEGDVAQDGAFSVTVAGSLDDAYEVVASNAKGDSEPRILGGTSGPGWKQLHRCSDEDPRDPLDVTDVRLEGDTLHVSVAHAGGCETHEYGLCFGDRWAESFPVQVRLTVLHDAHDDTCDALEHAELSFDLTPFQAAYEEAYLNEEGAASFSIDACSDADGCGVVYEWRSLPEAPKAWVPHATDCGFAFEGPADLEHVPVQGTDSCVVEYQSELCSVQGDSGAFSDNFDSLAEEPEHAQFSVDLGPREAQVHTARLEGEDGEPPRYVVGIYAPEPDSGLALGLFVDCETAEARDALLPLARTLTFE